MIPPKRIYAMVCKMTLPLRLANTRRKDQEKRKRWKQYEEQSVHHNC